MRVWLLLLLLNLPASAAPDAADVEAVESFILVQLELRGTRTADLPRYFLGRLRAALDQARTEAPSEFQVLARDIGASDEAQITGMFVALRDAPARFADYVRSRARLSHGRGAPARAAPEPGSARAATLLREYERYLSHRGLMGAYEMPLEVSDSGGMSMDQLFDQGRAADASVSADGPLPPRGPAAR